MPYLRPVASSVSSAATEIRSSKTLIGSGQSKCDVVLPADQGVLDLHALLNLSADQSTATLVPFSATAGGACFLNGRLVPSQGATVVHGDRVAFGSADNAFVFSLTDANKTKSSLENSRSFRRTLDALRGDRAPVASSSQSVATSKILPREPVDSVPKPLMASGSRDRLERFLLDASSDSLLGDYVERKLRASAASSSNSKPLRGQRRVAMEPPPSLSVSTGSSLQSSLTDSILDRSTCNRARESTSSSLGMGILDKSQSLLSTAERNYAEIEKLRLSQRLREVNSVLNGHLSFESSYLPTDRQSAGSASMRFSSPLKSMARAKKIEKADTQGNAAGGEDHDYDKEMQHEQDDEEENEEDLPAMVEKPRTTAMRTPGARASVAGSPQKSTKSSIASLLGKSLAQSESAAPEATAVDAASDDNQDELEDVALDESLPSFSEAILKRHSTSKANSGSHSIQGATLGSKSSAADHATPAQAIPQVLPKSMTPEPAQQPVRPQLHQQLIDRTLRRKRQELLSDGFLRWRRGLRVQEQRRRDKVRQQQILNKKLALLRRNQSFSQWKRWSQHTQQVRECREEAFVQRHAMRSLGKVWLLWGVSTLHSKHKRRVLLRMAMVVSGMRLRDGFRRWVHHTTTMSVTLVQHQAAQSQQREMDKRMHHVAVRHYQLRLQKVSVVRVFRAWKTCANRSHEQARGFRRVLQLMLHRRQRQAWVTWRQNAILIHHATQAEITRQKDIEQTRAVTTQQLTAQQTDLQGRHDSLLQELRKKIQDQERQLHTHEQERQENKKRMAANRARAKAEWNESLEQLLEQCITQADARISDVSTRLERLLQQMDAVPETARFQAATFLVESMLEQKQRHVNERVRAQEQLLHAMESGSFNSGDPAQHKVSDDTVWKNTLASNARFLLDMVHQRQARLHQLYHAVAKLAATVMEPIEGVGGLRTDAAKFKHAAFLTDTMNERAISQLDTLFGIHYRRYELGLVAEMTDTDRAREARKY